MSEQPTQKSPHDKLPPPTRAQRLAAFGFLGAFGLTILTVLLTGLRVGVPAVRHVVQPVPPAVESGAPAEPGAPSATSRAAPSVPATAPPSVDEQRKNEDAVGEDSARDPHDATRKNSRRNADDSRAHDAR